MLSLIKNIESINTHLFQITTRLKAQNGTDVIVYYDQQLQEVNDHGQVVPQAVYDDLKLITDFSDAFGTKYDPTRHYYYQDIATQQNLSDSIAAIAMTIASWNLLSIMQSNSIYSDQDTDDILADKLNDLMHQLGQSKPTNTSNPFNNYQPSSKNNSQANSPFDDGGLSDLLDDDLDSYNDIYDYDDDLEP